MKAAYEWLVYSPPEEGVDTLASKPWNGDIPWQSFPLDPELASGGFEKINLAMGMTFFHARHQFTPRAADQLIPLGQFNVEFTEPSFVVNMLSDGRIVQEEQEPLKRVSFSRGVDLFRYASGFRTIPLLDANRDNEMVSLCMGRSVLDLFVGEPCSQVILEGLGVVSEPVAVRRIPHYVDAPLWSALESEVRGKMRVLQYQSKALDYLLLLIQHIEASRNTGPDQQIKRAHDVHDYLLSLEGKLPSLDELALHFGRSAKALNNDFYCVFGSSIVRFILAERLKQAHDAIAETDVALKSIASRLGYSHVNHFITAFRKEFGYPPGALRKVKRQSVGQTSPEKHRL